MASNSIETQLANYGVFVREQLAQTETSSLPTYVSDAPSKRPRRRPSAAMLLRVAAVMVPIAGLVAGVVGLRRPADELVALRVESAEDIERRATDTEVFIQALASVDFELKVTGSRAPTEGEVGDVVNKYTERGLRIIPDSVTIVQDLESGDSVVEFNVVPTGRDDLGNGIVVDRCRVIANRSSDGFSDVASNGSACFDPDFDQLEGQARQYAFSYGCQPKFFLGGSLFGKRDFEVIVEVVADSPGVIVTLENGDNVLVRPIDGMAVYTGPPADRVTIYTANGEAKTISTASCL